MKKFKFFGMLAVAAMFASLLVTGPASAAGIPISVRSQDVSSGQVYVDSVTAPQDGWLLIRKDENGAPGGVLGFAPLHQGLNTAITVAIRTSSKNSSDLLTSTLWASVAADPYAMSPFATLPDGIESESSLGYVAFGSTAAPAAPSQAPAARASSASATSANKIAVGAQDTVNGSVFVDSVTAAQDGWLLIRRDENGAPGGVLGFAAVHQGLNMGMIVDIRSTKKNGEDAITPTLWATLVADSNANSPFATPDDGVLDLGSQAMATFGSSAAYGMGR